MGDQGIFALWKGNSANLYGNIGKIILRISIYDRIKHFYMPKNINEYEGFEFYWRYYA